MSDTIYNPMECSMCSPNPKYQRLQVKKYIYWRIEVRANQNYLGWCCIVLNRHITDLMDITPEERDELFIITKRLRDIVKEQFGANMINYASLGNIVQHVHIQFVPRYSKPVEFEGLEFRDARWGKNYSPYDKEFQVSDEILYAIRDRLADALAGT